VVGPASLGSCTGSAVNQIISLEPSVTPIFNYINQTYCKDAVITQPILLQTSVNGITGTWSPAAISTSNLGTTTYTFTPNSGQCANTTSFTVSINNLPSTDGIYHD
jgi:hypothetical protein